METDIPLGLRFTLLHRAFRRRMDQLLREKDLTGVQFGVLCALKKLEQSGAEEIHQKDLEQMTRTSHPTMTDILRRLEKKELILCRASQIDRRFKRVSSTEKAQSFLREMNQLEQETFQWLCRGLTEEQIRTLLAVTDQMLQNACEDNEKGCEA